MMKLNTNIALQNAAIWNTPFGAHTNQRLQAKSISRKLIYILDFYFLHMNRHKLATWIIRRVTPVRRLDTCQTYTYSLQVIYYLW